MNEELASEAEETRFGYAEAESILDGWDYDDLPDGDEVISAIMKALQALRDCQELGLNGYGD